MIRHVVMFKFKEEADGRSKAENIEITMEMLEKLPSYIPQIKHTELHTNCNEVGEFDYDLLLISDFESIEAMNEYLVHPKHKEVGAFMRPVRISRACIDFEY